MTKWIIAIAGLAALVLLVRALVVSTVLGTLLAVATDAFYPERISWDAKNAWSKCEGALAGSIAWPADPDRACQAMRMCQNEAPFTPRQSADLDEAIGRLPGCGAP